MQFGRFAAAVEPEPLPRPVDVEPDAPPVPWVPKLPEEPSVLPAAELPVVLLLEPDPSLESLEPEVGLLLALFNLMFPFTSLQWVAADTEGVEVAADEPLIEPELDCAEALSTPHAISAEARSVVWGTFMGISCHYPTRPQSSDRWPVPGT